MYWRPIVSILVCFVSCHTWVGRAKMNATYLIRQDSWVRGVDDCGPPRGPIRVCCHFAPEMMPLEFIISCVVVVCVFSVLTVVNWSVCRGCGLPNHHDLGCGLPNPHPIPTNLRTLELRKISNHAATAVDEVAQGDTSRLRSTIRHDCGSRALAWAKCPTVGAQVII